MEGFLKQIATDLWKQYSHTIAGQTIVFPNRRAGLFFTDYLNALIDKPVFAPEIISINELFSGLSDLYVPDKLNLIFRLYKVYRDLTHTRETFDEFYFWGDMIISDFDQVDKYMADAESLFANITQLKEIEERFSSFRPEDKARIEAFWKSLENEEKSSGQREFIKLWKELQAIYITFKQQLKEEKLAYEGMLFREVTENLKLQQPAYIAERNFVFAGFNALNRCEEKLFLYLKEVGKAQFYWDYDHYYLDDKLQEAGWFMRDNLLKFPQKSTPYSTNGLKDQSKAIQTIGIPSQTGQAQIVSKKLLQRNDHNFRFDDTAIVLCDEELLLPVISAIPENIDNINITMGLPLKISPLFSLIAQLIELQQNGNTTKKLFYCKNVSAIVNHQMVASIFPELAKTLSEKIIRNNAVYFEENQLHHNKLFALVFNTISDVVRLPDYFLDILNELYRLWEQNETLKNAAIFKEYIYQAYTIINNLKNNIFEEGFKILGEKNFITRDTLFRFINEYLTGISVPFEGEPLKGLQVMGILETRTLDFQNLIFLSMNDGIMPRSNPGSSFIPYNLRRGFGLPTVEEQNAMYAYYFYRLLQRAGHITFVYNSGSDGLSTGEKSRFIYQLQTESGIPIQETSASYNMGQIEIKPIKVAKDEKVISIMQKWVTGEKMLSPSALDKYLTCPLRFYFNYVAGIREPDEVAEEIDPRVFGLVVHHTMEHLYRPFLGKEIQLGHLENLLNDIDQIEQTLISAFRIHYFKNLRSDEPVEFSGQNWLVYQMVKKYVVGIIRFDGSRAPFELTGIEMKMSAKVRMNDQQQVTIGGIIDRVNRFNDTIEIADYKTGKTDLKVNMLADLFNCELKTRNKAAFQTLVYCYMMKQNYRFENEIVPAIYGLRDMLKENYQPHLVLKETGTDKLKYSTVEVSFSEMLAKLLEEIFDSQTPFCQTILTENCNNCPYKNICQR